MVLRSLALATLALATLGCAGRPPASEPVALAAPPLDAGAALHPGLAVRYWYVMLRDLRELPAWQRAQPGLPGPPLDHLDHAMGDGTVLTSGVSDAVAAEITGFIQLDRTGTFAFQAISNDGIRIEIGGAIVADDPDVHSDRPTPPRHVVVDSPGWYPLRIHYFERRYTATLRVLWQPPGAPVPANIPASALRRRIVD